MPQKTAFKKFQPLLKPTLVIIAIFLVGFSLPVMLKNYLSKKAGTVPSSLPAPQLTKLAPPYYQYEVEKLTLTVGETKRIKIFLNTNKQPLQAFDFVASYDPAVVNVAAVEATPLFSSYPVIEYGEGKIVVSGNIGVKEESFATNDTLLLLTLEGKTKGETALVINKDSSTISSKGENILNEVNSVKITVD